AQKIELNGRIGALNNCGIVSETDSQGNIIFINEEAERVWGYQADEIKGKKHNVLKSGEHNEDFYKSLWTTISSGNVWKGEIKNLAKDGADFWVQLTITPVLNNENIPIKYIGVGFEITRIKRQSLRIKELFNESKKQEEELRNQAHKLQELHKEMLAAQTELTGRINAMNNASLVSEANLEGKIIFVNDEALAVWGYTRDEVIGRKHNIIKSGRHDDEFYAHMWSTITQGKVWKGQLQNKTKDGSFFWIELTITPVLDEAGMPLKYIGVGYEITQQKIQSQRIREALILSEKNETELRNKINDLQNEIDRMNAILQTYNLNKENIYNNGKLPVHRRTADLDILRQLKEYMNSIVANVMMFEFNLEGRICDLNSAFVNCLSLDKTSVLDKPFTALFSPDTPHGKVSEIVKELKNRQVWTGKVELFSKSHGVMNCNLKMFPYTNERGSFEKFICIVLEEKEELLYSLS
ncbi:MAG: PAS domain S-box protein, partial [Bacteroidia bacterium]|nr:PAS domain S-box protein [Bacteroidia bacterium]